MTTLMRALLLLLALLPALALGQSCNPSEPRIDPGTTFTPFAALERLEVRGGRPANQDWEWGLGTNTQQTGSFEKAYLDWVSGRVLTYTLSYNGAGAGTFTVYDGATQLTTKTWNDPAKPLRAGNALKFYVKSSADSGSATVQATVATINGLPASGSIQTAGNSQFSEQAMYWYFPAMANGFTVTGTVTLTYPGTNPPQGSRLNFIVTAGNISCQQASAPPGMYFIHVDHLNTPRLVANQSGQTVWRWDQQEPFGNNVPDDNPSGLGIFEFPLRLGGLQYFDRETGSFHIGARSYSPQEGRFQQSDPAGMDGDINSYAYSENAPVDGVDTDGERRRPQTKKGAPNSPQNPAKKIGNCSPAMGSFLQGLVNFWCSKPHHCSPNDSCSENKLKTKVASNCATARRNINQQCFNGGDAGHKIAEENAKTAVKNCIALQPICCKDQQ